MFNVLHLWKLLAQLIAHILLRQTHVRVPLVTRYPGNIDKFLYEGSTPSSKEKLHKDDIIFQKKYRSLKPIKIDKNICCSSIIRNYGCAFFRKIILDVDNIAYKDLITYANEIDGKEFLWCVFICYLLGGEADRYYLRPVLAEFDNDAINNMVVRVIRLTGVKDHEVITRILEIDYLLTAETKIVVVNQIKEQDDEYMLDFLECIEFVDPTI